jgi:hypothetical protein
MQTKGIEDGDADCLHAYSGEVPDKQAVYAGDCTAGILFIFVGNKDEHHVGEGTVVFKEEEGDKYDGEY